MKSTITIIGLGRVGKLLYKTLQKAGYDQISIITGEDEIVFLNDYIIIAVPDDNIQCVIDEIQQSGLNIKGKTFVHTSGVVGLDVFTRLRQNKIKVGCFHPLMAVTDSSESFQGITFDICGDKTFVKDIEPIVEDLDAHLIVVDEYQKAKLHLAAVITSNYLVTLMGMSHELFVESDLNQDQLHRALIPLMQSALNNLEMQAPPEALTGPIARGDVETITRHLSLLKDKPELKSAYQKLGSETLRLFSARITDDVMSELNKLFHEA